MPRRAATAAAAATPGAASASAAAAPPVAAAGLFSLPESLTFYAITLMFTGAWYTHVREYAPSAVRSTCSSPTQDMGIYPVATPSNPSQ